MTIDLKPYQEKAVDELLDSVKKLLSKDGMKKVCVFQAPTGSGKTIMTARFIEEIINELPNEELCFVWVTIGKGELHLQSKHALKKIYCGFPRTSLVEEEFTGGRERIVRNEVVVVNWEKLRSKDRTTGEWKNILMKDGENTNFRDVLLKTREQRKIILIIDESHIGATAERTQELRDEINADVILEMSATPRLAPDRRDEVRGLAAYVGVDPKDVIEAGVIKKELIINERIDRISNDDTDSQEVVLEAAYQKRLELKKLFELEGSKINPLVLVQIPTAEAGKDKIEAVKKFLLGKGIYENNGKLAIWLSDQKSETLDQIADLENGIDFLIFKQAIDTGWDCPRAHILVKFRESDSETFEIQTVGRILRMPELRHYANEALNIGYIYTNVPSIIVRREEYNPNIIKHLRSVRKSCYKDLKIPSYYKSRVDYGDITSGFTAVFEKTACETFGIAERDYFDQNKGVVGKKGVVIDLEKYQQEIIRDARVEGISFDDLKGIINAGQKTSLNVAGDDLRSQFEQIIKNNLGSFRSMKRSVPSVKTAVYVWFQRYLGSKCWDEETAMVQKIFIQNGNREVFESILLKAVETYRATREIEVAKRVEASGQINDFDVPKERFYNSHTDEFMETDRCVYDRCYLNIERTNPEKEFEKYLESKSKVKNIIWWWKNGEGKKDYFGIRYEYPKGCVRTFYPDYLVQFKDGRVGIFETKDTHDQEGSTTTKAKSERLQEYINEQNTRGMKLFGGVVVYLGRSWKINQKLNYDWEKCLRRIWTDWQDCE